MRHAMDPLGSHFGGIIEVPENDSNQGHAMQQYQQQWQRYYQQLQQQQYQQQQQAWAMYQQMCSQAHGQLEHQGLSRASSMTSAAGSPYAGAYAHAAQMYQVQLQQAASRSVASASEASNVAIPTATPSAIPAQANQPLAPPAQVAQPGIAAPAGGVDGQPAVAGAPAMPQPVVEEPQVPQRNFVNLFQPLVAFRLFMFYYLFCSPSIGEWKRLGFIFALFLYYLYQVDFVGYLCPGRAQQRQEEPQGDVIERGPNDADGPENANAENRAPARALTKRELVERFVIGLFASLLPSWNPTIRV